MRYSVFKDSGLRAAWIAALFLVGFSSATLAEGGAMAEKGRLLTSGLQGASGATVGPDGALYVVEGALGQVTRINPRNGKRSVFATGLPPAFDFVGIGGAIDVEFIGETAYVLVTLVGEFGGGPDGIYRITAKDMTGELPIADLGTFSALNPPSTPFELFHGVQYAMEPVDQGFVVSDGHHNRLLHVTLDGTISELKQYDNIVPTGLAGDVGTLYVAEFGAVPNAPESGKVISLGLLTPAVDRPAVAAGVSMIVDVEFGPDGELYALSQGDLAVDIPGAPALPDTGRLLKVNDDGTFAILAQGLDRPTSLNFVCDDALVVTLTGNVLKFGHVGVHGKRCRGHCR